MGPRSMRFRLAVLLVAGMSLASTFGSSSVSVGQAAMTEPLSDERYGRGVVDESRRRIAGHVVVKFHDSVGSRERQAAWTEHGLVWAKSVRPVGIHLLRTEPGQELAAVRRLQRDGRVLFAEPNYVIRRMGHLVPADPLYGTNQADLPLIGMPDAWHLTTGSSSIITAVIDGGIDFGHSDIDSRIANLTGTGLPGADHVFLSNPSAECPPATSPDDDGWRSTTAPFNHGTHVAGTIAAESTIVGDAALFIAGMAPGTRVAPLKALDCSGSGNTMDEAAAITFAATNGAKIVNLSVGSEGDTPTCTRSEQTAIDFAFSRGLFIVAASGNDGTTNRSSPAVCDHVVGVGATDNSDVVASFSQHNSTVDVSAPGVRIASLSRQTDGTRGASLASGTSMATPHVAGCAALIRSIAPTLGPDQVEAILRSTAVDLGDPGRDDLYGHGRIRCGLAVQAAASGPPPAATATSTPGPPSTPTPTPPAPSTPIPTPPAPSTPTPTLPPPAAVAITNFTLISAGAGLIGMTWTLTAAPATLELVRFNERGVLPTLPLAPTATNASESVPAGEVFRCYVVRAKNAQGDVVAASELECGVPRIATAGGPATISISAVGNLATVRWSAVAGATGYNMFPLIPQRPAIPTAATSAPFDTRGDLFCALVQALPTGGISDAVCIFTATLTP